MLFGNFRFATIAKSILNPQALYVRNGVGASLFTNLIHLIEKMRPMLHGSTKASLKLRMETLYRRASFFNQGRMPFRLTATNHRDSPMWLNILESLEFKTGIVPAPSSWQPLATAITTFCCIIARKTRSEEARAPAVFILSMYSLSSCKSTTIIFCLPISARLSKIFRIFANSNNTSEI